MDELKIYPGGDVHRRLDRIEQRLDRITDVLERMARVEERQTALDAGYHDDLVRIEAKLDDLQQRIEHVELQHANTAIIVKWAQMVFWLVIAGAIGLIGQHLLNGGLSKTLAPFW